YLMLPVWYQVFFGERKRGFFQIGPFLEVLLSGATFERPDTEISRINGPEKLEGGLSVGIGTQTPIGDNMHFLFSMMSNHGIRHPFGVTGGFRLMNIQSSINLVVGLEIDLT
ncbi:MAG: hypothetical protein AAFV07_14175, partial [Bacteroidota bacterium]